MAPVFPIPFEYDLQPDTGGNLPDYLQSGSIFDSCMNLPSGSVVFPVPHPFLFRPSPKILNPLLPHNKLLTENIFIPAAKMLYG